jgi:hypothetical protein
MATMIGTSVSVLNAALRSTPSWASPRPKDGPLLFQENRPNGMQTGPQRHSRTEALPAMVLRLSRSVR